MTTHLKDLGEIGLRHLLAIPTLSPRSDITPPSAYTTILGAKALQIDLIHDSDLISTYQNSLLLAWAGIVRLHFSRIRTVAIEYVYKVQ